MENIKQKSSEDKIKLVKDYIEGVNTDTVLALNVYSLIVPNKTFSDDFFNDENIMFNNIEDFLDIKITLKEELNNFIDKMLGIYIACIKHCSVMDESPDIKNIDVQYFKILCMLDIATLSNFMNKRTPVEDNNYYKESYGLIKNYCDRFSIYSSLIDQHYGEKDGN